MGERTGIAWTDATWNPVRGCSRESEGCRFCYAEKVASRFSGPGQPYHGFAERDRPGSKWTGRVDLIPHMLDQPLRWRKPRRIFVNSMSDLFHESLPDAAIDQVFGAMAQGSWHAMQVLTKRADRMQRYCSDPETPKRVWAAAGEIADPLYALGMQGAAWGGERPWPLKHVWLGVSVENQEAADERIPYLLATPAAVRFLSCEPLIGPLDLRDLCLGIGLRRDVDWVIVGGESGPGARPMLRHWAERLIKQCHTTGVPAFLKQVGSNRGPDWPGGITGKGDDPAQWPDEMLVQEFPR